jgi:ABC-type transporter Mla MlaB component
MEHHQGSMVQQNLAEVRHMVEAYSTVLEFSGAATIRTAEDIVIKLKQALAESDTLIIVCDDLKEVDITFIQLIASARKSAMVLGKTLQVSAPIGGELLKTLNRAGIQPTGSQSFWFQERSV